MATLTVQVNPSSPGTVDVRVWNCSGTSFDWSGTATSDQPLDQTWNDLDPGSYAVTISWSEGYQNIAGEGDGNSIVYNGNALVYQVLGNPSGTGIEVLATFSLQLT